jgi:hypothetical protein
MSITIIMTERAPLSLDPETWPVVASAKDWDGEHEFQASRKYAVAVRRHADGRSVVFGSYQSDYAGARGSAGGFLVPAGDASGVETARAIRRVAGIIQRPKIADLCIADLPAEQI